MRPDFKWSTSLKKLGWNALIVLAPLLAVYLEELQTQDLPKAAPLVAVALLILRWWQNASKKKPA